MPESPASVQGGESPFWQFSLRFYAEPDVAPACLVLQDEAGVDVNVLLLVLYLAQRNLVVTSADVRVLDGAIAAWREEAVKGLRGVRRWLKTPPEEISRDGAERLRTIVKKAELEAERLEQFTLERLASELRLITATSSAEAARANIAAYGAQLGPLPANAVDILLSALAKIS